MAIDNSYTPSRLLTSTAEFRDKLAARNLYAPMTQYPLQSKNVARQTVGAINSIIGAVTPFKSFNLENTVLGRALGTQTPLTTIGLAMLGKQFAFNAMSNLAQNNFPVIKVSNLFDGKSTTRLFTKRVNYNITVKAGDTGFKHFLTTIRSWIAPGSNYPFTKNPTNDEFIQNSGTGQLQFLYKAVNYNIYKQSDSTVFNEYATAVEMPIQPRGNITATKTYFNFDDKREYPYSLFYPLLQSKSFSDSVDFANFAMRMGAEDTATETQEYAPSAEFISKNFGKPDKSPIPEGKDLGITSDVDMNSWVQKDTEFSNNLNANKVIWGRDGILSAGATTNLSQLRGDEDDIIKNFAEGETDLRSKYNINTGLLAYTNNLISASDGNLVDITRKAFTKGDKLVGFNGSALWRAPSKSLKQFANRTGVRQHSALDQYDRFAKAIRFNGNNVYGGNPNSVIYDSVIPRVHPTLNADKTINNKNLMLSIENLAIKVISKDGVGIIDDEYGSPIPICEVGPFNGRIMWFPPFAMELNETAIAKYEPTVMVGRNEPMYNYQNSERTANLSFTLLVDYPPQLRNYRGKNKQKEIAEFFAFGGQPIDKSTYLNNLQLRITWIQLQIEKIRNNRPLAEPVFKTAPPFKIYYPNDVPKPSDNLSTVIDKMYSDYTYEIWKNFISCDSGINGYNKDIFFISGLTEYTNSGSTFYKFLIPPTFSQYTSVGKVNQDGFGDCTFNKSLRDIFDNEELREYYDIEILGSASLLHTEKNPFDITADTAYNLALGQRRADAAKKFVEQRLAAIYGKSFENLGITIKSTASKGSAGGSAIGATSAGIPVSVVKQERTATITIKRNTKAVKPKVVPVTPAEQATIDILLVELQTAQTELDSLGNLSADCVMNERKMAGNNGVGDGGILHGFASAADNYYYPIFHSQTPEDFHKRLTFLQQCTRQGSAKKYDSIEENGILRAKNSVFGRQPICILRIGDFFYTKVVIESVNIDYNDTTWDMNPEGFGMQPMIAKVTLQMKIIGGQSLKGPIDALQNAVSFNYYANSTFSSEGMYRLPAAMAEIQDSYKNGVDAANTAIIDRFNNRNITFRADPKNEELFKPKQ